MQETLLDLGIGVKLNTTNKMPTFKIYPFHFKNAFPNRTNLIQKTNIHIHSHIHGCMSRGFISACECM